MSTTSPHDPVLALARQAERLARRVDELDGLLGQLATDVATLAQRLSPKEGEAPRAWLLEQEPAQAAGDLRELVAWLARVWLRYPDTSLPSCWLWHPALVEELRWLRCAHREAYDSERGSWSAVADWHDRLRAGAARRLRAAYGACELTEHAPGGTQHRPAPTVPLAEARDLAAHHWATNPDQPLIPSKDHIHDAETHDATQHHNNHQNTYP